ncbi:MAG: ADP-forming succinate--CoA ligase subunit beta [Gammaproteobacteria bacterium]|nr:ADP-forming succinate--CoA ligase subunit beta [Gammaproteobacteria bacterium]
MNLHEYQGKALFARYGLPVPESRLIRDPREINAALDAFLDAGRWVIKAQAHAGARGKAGGVKLIDARAEAVTFITDLLGSRLVTHQTGAEGKPVNEVLVERPCAIARELYVGIVIDRSKQRVVLMASTEGGVEIEKVAEETPEKILKVEIHPLVGLQPFQCRQLAFGLGLEGNQIKAFSALATGLSKLFHEQDLSLVEINPLVVTADGELLCLDAKVNIDDNALYRHKDSAEQRDLRQEDGREVEASQWGLNYIALEGTIGCMVNGAGLAMATMDLIKLVGGEPANFLDVGGTATSERVAEAFKIILSDGNVRGILVNIFGGIVRCDLIAEGIIAAVNEVGVEVPVVVRLEGTHADIGRKLLDDSGLEGIHAASGLTEAAEMIVNLAGGKG